MGGAASILELLEFALILEDHSGRLVAVTPASVADLSEREIEVSTSNTNPVTDALCILLNIDFTHQSLLFHYRCCRLKLAIKGCDLVLLFFDIVFQRRFGHFV